MFYRTATRKLEQWKDSPYRMPLIVRGARQVGKTTLINEFGKGTAIIFISILMTTHEPARCLK